MVVPDSFGRVGRAAGKVRRNVQVHVRYVVCAPPSNICFRLPATHPLPRGPLIRGLYCSGFTDAFYKALNERYVVGSETCAATSLWDVETGGMALSDLL